MEVFEDYASSPERVVNDAIDMSATRGGEVEIVGCSRAAQQVLWSKSQNRPDMRTSGYTRYEGFCHDNNHSWAILGL